MGRKKSTDAIPMDPICPRCNGKHGVEASGDGYEWDCAACGGHLMCAIGPDGGEMFPYHRDDDGDEDECPFCDYGCSACSPFVAAGPNGCTCGFNGDCNCSEPPAQLDWSRPRGEAQVGWFDRIKPTLGKKEASATPSRFRDALIDLARHTHATRGGSHALGDNRTSMLELMRPTLASRRARVARMQAKHPRDLVVEIEVDEEPGARDELVEVLFEVLDPRGHSRRR